MFESSDPWREAIGPYTAAQSPFRPALDDKHRRPWAEAWAKMAKAIKLDTARALRADLIVRGEFSFSWRFAAFGDDQPCMFACSAGVAAALCDVYAEAAHARLSMSFTGVPMLGSLAESVIHDALKQQRARYIVKAKPRE